MLTIRRRPDTVLSLREYLPTDSVVLERGENTIYISGQDAILHLEERLARYPHIISDSALLSAIREGLRTNGWARLQGTSEKAVERENFLIVNLLVRRQVAIRQGSRPRLVPEVRLIHWGTCAMANGRGVLLPDSTEVLRTLDGWHGCFDG